jgi:hypothetical protein
MHELSNCEYASIKIVIAIGRGGRSYHWMNSAPTYSARIQLGGQSYKSIVKCWSIYSMNLLRLENGYEMASERIVDQIKLVIQFSITHSTFRST